MSEQSGTSIASLADNQIRVVGAPMASVAGILFEVFYGSWGTPPEVLRAVVDSMDNRDLAFLSGVYAPGGPALIPDVFLPVPTGFSADFLDEIEIVLETGRSGLAAELVGGGFDVGPWRHAVGDPIRWTDTYVDIVRRVWPAVEPIWRGAVPRIEREAERLGAAVVRGAIDIVLDTLTPRSRVSDDRWLVCANGAAPIASGLVLQPMAVGPAARIVSYAEDGISYFAYPLKGTFERVTTRPTAPDGLVSLLGEPRARVLRLLSADTTAGELASMLGYSPAALSHHLEALERATLIERRRAGRHVIVHRRSRGSSLVDLYERP